MLDYGAHFICLTNISEIHFYSVYYMKYCGLSNNHGLCTHGNYLPALPDEARGFKGKKQLIYLNTEAGWLLVIYKRKCVAIERLNHM